MKRLAGVCKSIDAISEWTGKILSKLIFLIVGLIVVEVIMRYFFNTPIFFAYHTSLFMYTAFTLLAGGYCLLYRAHVRIDVIYSRLSRRTQAILDVITAGFVFLFVIFLLKAGYAAFVESWQIQETAIEAWRPVLWPARLALPISAALLLFQGVAKFSRDLFYAVSGRELS